MNNKLLITSLITGVGCLTSCNSDKGKTPNVVFIIADDLGYGDLSCYGQTKFHTPNIDRLASEGLRFTQCYSGTTVSAPSRTCLMTGLHSGHTPIRGNREIQPEGQMSLPQNYDNLFKVFKDAGYTTGCFGKWGLGAPDSVGAPNMQGVDDFFGYNCQRMAHNYYPDHLWDNEKRVDLPQNDNGEYGVYAQDLIHDQSLEFLEANKDNPFFMFVPNVLPHAELLVPNDSIFEKYSGVFPETPFVGCDSGQYFRKGGYCSQPQPRATFAAMVYRLDVYVGQIVEKLKELGIYDNTLIIFCSDNGPHFEGGADPNFFDSNGVLRGYKRDLYEGGIRVPMIMSWNGVIEKGETDFICAFWDFYPTFTDMTGRKTVNNTDGISLLPLLTGEGIQKSHDHLYFEFHEEGGRQAVRKGDWKLVLHNVSLGNDKVKVELFNLDDDVSEEHNVAESYPQIVDELREIAEKEHVPDNRWPLIK